jgi:RHS repeat-associated protein
MEVVDDNNLNVYITDNRILAPDLCRWWSIDPKYNKRYSLTPYNSMSNNPIIMVDPKGDDDYYTLGNQGTMLAISRTPGGTSDNFYRVDRNGNVSFMQNRPYTYVDAGGVTQQTGFAMLPDAQKTGVVNTLFNFTNKINNNQPGLKSTNEVPNDNGVSVNENSIQGIARPTGPVALNPTANPVGAVVAGAPAPAAAGVVAPVEFTGKYPDGKSFIRTVNPGDGTPSPAANAQYQVPIGTLPAPAPGTTAPLLPNTLPANRTRPAVDGNGQPNPQPVTNGTGTFIPY